jgi:hypothetical protein
VRIFIGVGEAMVVAVMGGPPERAALDGGVSEHRKDELPEAVGLKGLVGKIAVVETSDRKHAHQIEQGRHRNSDPAPAHPDHPQAHGVQYNKRKDAQPLHPIPVAGRHVRPSGFGVHPAKEGNEKA